MPRVIDLGEPYGQVSFPDDATDDHVVAEFEKLETERLRAAKEARMIAVRLADISKEQEPSIGKTLARTGLAMREGAAGSTKQMVGNVARTFADLFSLPESPLQAQPDTTSPELPVNILREAGRSLAEEGTKQRTEAAELGQDVGGGVTAAALESLGGTAGVSAPALLAAPLGLGAAAVAGGLQSYGINMSEFKDLIKQRNPNISDDEAFRQAQLPAALTGAATTILTRTFGGVERFIERIVKDRLGQSGVKELLKNAWRGASMEFPEEYGDQLAQGLIEKAFVNPDKQIGDIFNEAGMAGLAGLTIGGATIGGIGAAGSAGRAIAEKITEPSRMRRGEERRREVISKAVERGELLPEQRTYAQRTGIQTAAPGAETAPVQEATERVRIRDITPQGALETEARTTVTPVTPAPIVTPPPIPATIPPVVTPPIPKGGETVEEDEAKKEGQKILKQVLPAAETAAVGRSKAAPEIETTATPAVGSKPETEPVVETPAPAPAAATSESGTAPVTAGAEPPAVATVPPVEPAAKPEGEQTLTTGREMVNPTEDKPLGKNAAGEPLYERTNGSRYRMRFDRANRPNGYPDFGGDLAPADSPIAPTTDTKLESIRSKRAEIEKRLRAKFAQSSLGVDPEIATIAAELALNYAEEGVVRFSDFASKVKASMPDIWDRLKNYLRGAWTTASDIHDGLEEVTRADARLSLEALDRPAPVLPDRKSNEEQAEVQIIDQSREIALNTQDKSEAYRKIVALYQAQPRLGTRTVTSKTNQAYSTPPPLAYLSGVMADLDNGTVIAEPTAGNGMLFIAAPSSAQWLANELEPGRNARLQETFPQATMSMLDASSVEFHDYLTQMRPDRAVMNPPFGGVIQEGTTGTKRFTIINASTAKSETPSIDLAIALNTLDTLTPDGKAVVIIGAKTGSMSAQFGSTESRARAYKRPEMLEFFKRFNVVDWFTVDGSLYEKMGAGWPVDVIVIDGKQSTPTSAPRPWISPPIVFTSWESLEPKLYEANLRATGAVGGTPGGSSGGTEVPGGGGGGGGIRPARPPKRTGGVGAESTVDKPPRPQRPTEPVLETGGLDVVPESSPEQPRGSGGVGQPTTVSDEADPSGESLASRTSVLNVPYASVSKNADPKLVVPANIADAMSRAVRKLETDVGKSVDSYVAEKMGWSVPQLYKYLSSAQIEATGLFIRNSEYRKTGLVNSDQTGVGKGRVVASIIEYARRTGKTPVFITQGKHLYSDMAGRDLPSIGVKDFKPFITDAKYSYQNGKDQEVAEVHRARERRELMREYGNLGALPAAFDGVFTTYYQLQADKPDNWKEEPKARFKRKKKLEARPDGPRLAMLRQLAPNAIFILDEAHQAAGLDSDVGLSLQSILRNAAGVFYASATFAKRPDNLTLYSLGTGLKLAGLGPKEMAELFKGGGVPLQQALTTMLAEEGEFVRREQDMSGVKVSFKRISASPEEEAEKADTYTSFLRDMYRLSDMVNAAAQSEVDDVNQVAPEESQVDLASVNFGARLFNLSNQYLFSLRAESTARDAIDALGRGQKPFIAVYNTMAGPISDLVTMGLPLNFGGLLRREMAKMLELKIKDPSAEADPSQGLKKGERLIILKPEDLPDGGGFYYRVEEQIQNTDFSGMPISPIDAIKKGIQAAADPKTGKHYTVGEITAREGEVDESGDVVVLTKRDKRDRNKVLHDYNHGAIDVIVVNGSGSTGLSAHSDPKFKDQRQRYMIVAQAAPDINVFMQMLGRVMRFGQTSLPEFTILTTSLAAERRFMTMLRGKLTSLNANTSADTESGITQGGLADDIFNQIGDAIVSEVMLAHPDLASLARIDLPDFEKEGGVDNYARQATGKFVLLPDEDAARLWNDIGDLYTSRIRALDDAGENPLKANVQDLRAQVTGTAIIEKAQGKTAFDGPVTLDRVNIQPTKKAYSYDEAIAEEEADTDANRAKVQEWLVKQREALRARIETMVQRESTQEQIDRTRESFSKAEQNVIAASGLLGRVVGIDPTGTGNPSFYAIPVGIDLRSQATGDFSSSAKHTLTLATNTLRRKLHLPLSQLTSVMADMQQDMARDEFEKNSENTTVRYIAGTNLLRAYSVAGKLSINTTRPAVTMYTMRNGTIRTGVLMGAAFDPSIGGGSTRNEVVSADDFSNRVQQGGSMLSGVVKIISGEVRLPSGSIAKPVWGDRQFGTFFTSDPIERGGEFRGRLEPGRLRGFFDFLRSKGNKVFEAAESAAEPIVFKESKPDVIDAALTRAIEATDITRGKTLEGITGAPVWLTMSAANGALRVLRSAYRAGKTIAAAISDAVEWLRNQGIEDFDENAAKAWLETRSDEDAPDPMGGVMVEGASADVGRIAEAIVKERESAGLELEGLAYERKQFKMARSELKRLADIAYGRLGASLQEEPGAVVPDPRDGIEISEDGVIEVDDTFTDTLRGLGVDHDTGNVKDMQAEIFFENAAKRLNNLLANAETLQNAIRYYQALKVDEAEIRKIVRSLNRLNTRAEKLGSAELNGTSVSQRSAEIRAAESARPGRMAKRDSLSLEPVSDFFGRQVGAYRSFMSKVNAAVKLSGALRDAATDPAEMARLNEETEKWLRLPEEVRTAIVSGKPLTDEQRSSAFATLAEVFDDFDILKARMTEMQANRTPAIEKESKALLDSIATAKIESGMAEVMISDVLAALDGESGGTGTLQSQSTVQELRGRLTAIQNFALSVGRDLETNSALFDWLANPTAKPAFALSNANAFGTTPEVIQMILAEVKRNPDFGSAIVTLIESANKKLANLPITQLEAVSALVKDGNIAGARVAANRIMSRSNARASIAETARRGDLKKLDALEIERLSLEQGLAMFNELEASREFNSVRGLVANSPFGLVEPMVAQNSTTTTFKPFGASGIPSHVGLELGATDNPSLKDNWYRKVAEWHRTAQEHLDAYEAALALNTADPANNPSPATLGFDLSKVRGLRDAVERFVPGSFLEISLLSENSRWKIPWLVKFMSRTAWFRQHDLVVKMVGGQSGTDLRGRLGDFINNFLSARAIIQTYRDIPDKLHQALRSHPELKMNMADYRALWNEMAHWGRLFGSPVKAGFVLPVSGKAVTPQDITLLHRQRAFEEALRRQVTETTPVTGVRLQRGGRDLVRSGAYVGDEGLPRHLNRQADSFIADVLSVYSPDQGQTKANGFDSTTDISASSTHPVVQFWNQRIDLLVQHVLDARRGDRVVRLGPMMQQTETDAAATWLATGTPVIQSLEELVNQLVAHFPTAPGMNIRDQVIQGLNDELRQYRDAASRIEQERREREQARIAGVSIAFSADNEFTRPAAKLELPSRFYDYGAITPGEHLVVTSRANHERVVAYATALQRAIGDLRNRLTRFQDGSITEQQAATAYGGNIEELKQVLAVLQMVSADFESAYRMGNPSLSQSQWYREGFGLLTSAVLALPTVNLRNMTQGQFEVYLMSRAMGLGGHRLTMWRALKGMVRTVARYGLHIGGGAMKRVDLGVAMLTGNNVKLFEQLVDQVAVLILQPDYKTSAATVLNLGYDSRDGFLDRMKRIWQETSEISDREDAASIRLPGTQRKMAAVMGVPVKALRATFDKIGVLESDLTINSSLLTYATWLEQRLEEVAMVYGSERRQLGLVSFDATDPRWQMKPDEWASFSSQQANADSLSLFRLFLESSANAEGFQLERSLWDFYQKRSSGKRPKVFNTRQFDAVQRGLLAQFNASTPANRASAAAGNNVIRNLLTLQGYVSDGLLKLINTTVGGTRDRKAVGILASKLPIMTGIAVMATLIGYFAGAIVGEWERRIRGRSPTLPTPLDRDFWTNWKRFGENTARLSAAQLFYIGDIILALRGEVQGNRGFDPVGRVFPISMVQRAFNSLRGMWTTEGTVADKLVPMADFGRSMTPWWLELENAFGNAQGAIKQGERVLRGEAQVQGLLPEKRGQSFQGPSYGPTTVIRRKLGEAVSAYWKADTAGNATGATSAMADAQEQLAKLREFYEAKYTEAGLSPLEARTKAEADVWRDYQEINPAVAAMLGKRPTDGEWKLIRGGMTGERAKTVDDAVAAWQKGASVLFGRRGSITKEDVAANRPSSGGGGGIAGMASAMPRAALPSTRRTSRLAPLSTVSISAPYSGVSSSRPRSLTRLRRPRGLRRRRTARKSVLRRQRSPRVSTRRRITRRRPSYIRA